MRAVQAMTGSGGWPMTVFLLPDGTPFFSGTYFPPSDRLGMPSFPRVLAAVADAFAKRPADVEETAAQVRDFLNRPSVPLALGALTPALLDEAATGLERDIDPVHGGFGGAPKFPQPMLVEVLLRHHVRTGKPAALEMALQTLRAMADGGIHDQLGGGFRRRKHPGLRPARDDVARGPVLLEPRRGQRRRGGPLLCVDAAGARNRARR
jgi:uncharacterized protein YyaL (SSP411 family)